MSPAHRARARTGGWSVTDGKIGTPAPVPEAGPPLVPALGGAGPVTVVEGTTFCLSSAGGDVVPGTPHGLFFRDARVLSRWELRLDGEPPHALSVTAPEAFAARFVLRRPPQAGLADSTLLVVRERLVGDGMHEAITLTNLGREATALTVTMHVDADFADLFAVKEGRTPAVLSHGEVRGSELLLTRADGSRGVRLTATGDPLLTPGSLVWRTVIPPRGTWTPELLAQPIVASRTGVLLRHRRPHPAVRHAAGRGRALGRRPGAGPAAAARRRRGPRLDRAVRRPRRRRVRRVPPGHRPGPGQPGLEGQLRRDQRPGRPVGRAADRALRGAGVRLRRLPRPRLPRRDARR